MILAGYPPIPSLVKPAEAAALEVAAAGARVVEIGAAWGFSTVLLAQVARSVVSIDPHEEWDTWRVFEDNLHRFGVRDRVRVERRRSADALPDLLLELGAGAFDLAFVDGEHSYAACASDLSWAIHLVRVGGIIAVHDYCLRWPGVMRAVDERLIGFGSTSTGWPAWRVQDLYLAAV